MVKSKQLEIKLIRSLAKCLESHKACVRGLGIKRIHQSVTVNDTPEIRGMIQKVAYLLEISDNPAG